MNGLVTTNADPIDPSQLPPPRRGDRTRLLFLTTYVLGFKTLHARLEEATARRDDVLAVHVKLLPPRSRDLVRAGVQPVRMWNLGALHLLADWRWRKRRKRMSAWLQSHTPLDRFDAVHVTVHSQSPGVFDLQQDGWPRVAINTDSCAGFRLTNPDEDPATARMKRRERPLFSRADAIFSMSRTAADVITRDYSVDPGRIAIVPPSIPVPDQPPRRAPRGAHEPVRVVFIGNRFSRKGGPQLLAWHQAHFADRCELHIVSADADLTSPPPNVFWHKFIPNDQLRGEFLPSMDLKVFPTTSDLSPWVLVEAAAAGLPVVTTRVGAIPEIVIDGKTGLIVPPGDGDAFVAAMRRMIDSPQLRQEMGDAAYQHAAAHHNCVTNYNKLIDRLIAISR